MIFRLIILQAIFYVLLFPISVNSQSVWQRIEDYDDIDNAKWIESTDQYIYALHEVQDGSLGPVVQVLTQWSLNGNLNWRKYFEIEYGNVWNGPSITLIDGGIILDLIYQDSTTYEHRIHRMKSNGDIQWVKKFPRVVTGTYAFGSTYYDIELSEEGNFLFYNFMFSFRSPDPFSVRNGLLTLNPDGEEIGYVFYDIGDTIKWPFWVSQSPDGNFIRTYRPKKPHIDQTYAVEKININGEIIWTYDLGVEEGGGSKGPVCTDEHGNVYFTWKMDTTGQGGFWDAYPGIHALSPNGEWRWTKFCGSSDNSYQFLGDILYSAQKNIVACGSETNGFISGKANTGWLVSVDTLGSIIWERRYVLEETETFGNWFWSMTQTTDGGFAILGEMFPADNSSFQNLWIIKTDSMGCLIPGCGLYSYISILTGTEETTSVDRVKIMLHCTSESLHLFPITRGDFSALTYAIHSMDGTQLLHDRMNEENEVNVATLPPGIYVFTLLHQSGQLIGSAKFWKP